MPRSFSSFEIRIHSIAEGNDNEYLETTQLICIQDFLITLYYLIPANYQLRLNFGAKKELLKGDYQRIQLCRPSRWP